MAENWKTLSQQSWSNLYHDVHEKHQHGDFRLTSDNSVVFRIGFQTEGLCGLFKHVSLFSDSIYNIVLTKFISKIWQHDNNDTTKLDGQETRAVETIRTKCGLKVKTVPNLNIHHC